MTDCPAASASIKLIAGLGNPGKRYAKTRHNIGFMVLDEIARRLGSRGWRDERLASICDVSLGSASLLLVKPQTFMNLSGHAVVAYASRAKAAPENILVIGDDLDLPLGRLRLRPDGRPGGHNGLRSIASELQTESFARLRVGIGRPAEEDPIDYVLAPFSEAEAVHLPAIVSAACEMAVGTVELGLIVAMNRFNGRSNLLDSPERVDHPIGTAAAAPPDADGEHA